MRGKFEAILQNKAFFLWSFRASAVFLFLSVFAILFVLVEVLTGTLGDRFLYISHHYLLVIFAWTSTFGGLVAICFIYTMLLFYLNRIYRPILQWAWFISVVALSASVIFHLIELTIIPNLLKLLIESPLSSVSQIFSMLNHALFQLAGLFIPVTFSICGLIYTAVMFRTEEISLALSCWSLGIWATVLLGSCLVSYLGVQVFFLLSIVILLFIPWVWQVGELAKKS